MNNQIITILFKYNCKNFTEMSGKHVGEYVFFCTITSSALASDSNCVANTDCSFVFVNFVEDSNNPASAIA